MDLKLRFTPQKYTFDTVDEQICTAVLATGVLVSVCAFIMVIVQDLGFNALAVSAAGVSWFALHLGICLGRRKAGPVQRILVVAVLNLLLLPAAFFTSGGLGGGIALFYLIGIFNAAVILRGYPRIVVLVLSLAVMIGTFCYSSVHPEIISRLTSAQKNSDTILALFLTGSTLSALAILILRAYESERDRNLELMERLRGMSTRDALSGLYNRRELTRRLDLVYKAPQERTMRDEHLKREGCYIAMFDVDNFKHLNDTYGHQFGDTVLTNVAQKLNEAMNPKSAEFAARYGGEEFVCLFYAKNADDAFRRVDKIRQNVAELKWKNVPGLSVTVSGGLVSCEKYDQLKRAMLDVDKLLYQSKHAGKNQISTKLNEEEKDMPLL